MQQQHATAGTAAGGKSEGGRKGRPARSPRKRSGRRGIIWLFFVVLLGVVCAVVGYLLILLNGERILSQNLNKLNLDKASIIVDRNGNQVAKLSVLQGNREFVPINQIPPMVKNAFLATEDKRFYEHGGVDLFGIGRALVKDVISRSAAQGASTITQQVARNLFLNTDKTIFRKGTEASIALALEKHKSKDEILELYLNRIYFGKGQYGIKTAAKYYFNKDITSKDPKQQLEIWQIATLAGIPKGPSIYNPIQNPEKSKERRAVVLSLMQQQGLITAQEEETAKQVDYNPDVVPKYNTDYQSYTDYVVEEAKTLTGKTEEELLSGGFTIKTTIDTKTQKIMENAFNNDAMFEKSKDDVKMQGAMVIMDQHDGSLIAMAGGRDYAKKGLNRVTIKRQPGSSFKPIVAYGPAIETGNYFPWSTLRDDKVCYNNGQYCPTDSNRYKYIGPVSMEQATKESRNQPAVWTLNQIGITTGLNFADKLGIQLDKKEDRNLAIALGGLYNGASPLEMARAYGAFANGGTLEDAHSILSITNDRGSVVYEYTGDNGKKVMAPQTAYYVTQMLESVIQPGGTGTLARISGRPVAGKTGTTQHGLPGNYDGNRDVWFVGYTPEWTAAVWMGYDHTDPKHLVKQSSGQTSAMFSAVMSKALQGKKHLSFPKPDNVTDQKPANTVSGLTAAYNPVNMSVDLAWTANTATPGTTYKVYRKTDTETAFQMLAESAAPSLQDFAILPDQTLTYYVTAYDPQSKTESAPSGQVAVKITTDMGSPSPTPSDSPSPSPSDSGQLPGGDNGGGGGNGGGNGAGGGNGDNGGGNGGNGGGLPSPSPSPTPSPTPSPSPSPTPSTVPNKSGVNISPAASSSP